MFLFGVSPPGPVVPVVNLASGALFVMVAPVFSSGADPSVFRFACLPSFLPSNNTARTQPQVFIYLHVAIHFDVCLSVVLHFPCLFSYGCFPRLFPCFRFAFNWYFNNTATRIFAKNNLLDSQLFKNRL